MELATKEVNQLISVLAEPVLRERGLLMRPIPFFERFDRFRAREEELALVCERYLIQFNETAAHRVLRSYAFADELSRDVLRNFYPSLPEEGGHAQSTLWGVAVAIDQLLDEEGVNLASLAPVREWVAEQAWDDSYPNNNGRLHLSNHGLDVLVSMLEDTFVDCQRRAVDASAYAAFLTDLVRMLDAELASLSVTLDTPPVERVRRIVRDKSVLLSWVGFRVCTLGQQFDPMEESNYQEICDAAGEVLWIMDDLMDLVEDLDRGVWNRTLWRLFDDVGEDRFGELARSRVRLAEEILNQGRVVREIDEIAKRVAFLETHPLMEDPSKVRAMMSFWITSWMGIYR